VGQVFVQDNHWSPVGQSQANRVVTRSRPVETLMRVGPALTLRRRPRPEALCQMEYVAKQKARLLVLNGKAQRVGFSVHSSIGNELHYGWWYILVEGSGPSDKRVAAICNNLDDVDTFLAEKKRQAVKGTR
jgi:hypothetical protein